MDDAKMPTPARFHQPCWELLLCEETPQEEQYLVWGPGEVTHEGHPTGKTREHWQSNWQTHNGDRGGGTRGATLEEVLSIFPGPIAEKFRQVIEEVEAQG